MYIHTGDPKWYFISNPKCGSTSVKKIISDNFDDNAIKMGCRETIDLSKRVHGVEDGYGITIIRNPYSRIVSFFYHKLKIAAEWHIENGSYRPSLEPVARSLDKDLLENRIETLKYIKSLEFPEFIQNYKYRFRDDVHTRPLTDNLVDSNGSLKVDYVFKLENLKSKWHLLERLMGRKMEIQHSNETETERKDYREYYDESSKELVYELYKDDIEFFNYDF